MRNYWQERFRKLEEATNKYGQETYREIEQSFGRAQADIQKEIDVWYARIAKNNEISIAEARKLLSKNELKEFHWDVQEYIKYGKENALNQKWVKELENASAKFHVSRLEALKIRTQHIAEKAFGNEVDLVDELARKAYTESYYRSIFEVQKGFGVGFDVGEIDEGKLEKLISKPWASDGKNFSSRIWDKKSQMVDELHRELTRTCILGVSPDGAIKSMTRFVNGRFKNAKAQAGRLVMTESAFFASVSQRDAFNMLGVEEFEVVATLDSHTSPICRSMDGKHFPMSDFIEGSTAPPYHVWCRSTTCPYFNDEFTKDDLRAARNADNKTHYVPSHMKYPEWKNKYVESKEPFYDNTNRWSVVSPEKSKNVEDLKEYEVDGKLYKVDGFNVVLDYSKKEREIADLIASRYGKNVQMVPRVNIPQDVNTPDYKIDGVKYDLKTIKGSGKSTIYDAVKKGKKQANCFVLDVSETPLSMSDVDRQVANLYTSLHTRYVDEVVVYKDNEIVKAYKRKI